MGRPFFVLPPYTSLLVTPLHAAHAALGGKLVDFAGWEMPLDYGSILEEARTVRAGAGLFDVSHTQNQAKHLYYQCFSCI